MVRVMSSIGKGVWFSSRVGAGDEASDGPRSPENRVMADINTNYHQVFLRMGGKRTR